MSLFVYSNRRLCSGMRVSAMPATGVAAECKSHVDQCKKAEQPGWKLLKKVAEGAQETAKKHDEARTEGLRYQKIVEMMSSRCKNFAMLNLTLHKCSASEHVAGRPAHLMTPAFHVFGFRFKPS